MTACIREQYFHYCFDDDDAVSDDEGEESLREHCVNGTLTLAENIADNAGERHGRNRLMGGTDHPLLSPPNKRRARFGLSPKKIELMNKYQHL